MASFKERFLSSTSASITEKVQEKSVEVQPKVNRLKRPKKNTGKENPASVRTEGVDICSGSTANDGRSKSSTPTRVSSRKIKSRGAPDEDSGRFPPKHELLSLKRSLRQTKLNIKSTHGSSMWIKDARCLSSDVIDLCEDEDVSMATTGPVKSLRLCNDPPQATTANSFSRTRRDDKDGGVRPLLPTIQSQTELLETTFKKMRSGRREDFPDETREKLLGQIQRQNHHFPVQRVFSQLLRRQRQWKQGVNSCESSSPLVPEKRKPDAEFLPEQRPQKRQRVTGGGECVSVCLNTQSPHIKACRLSVSRRKKQAHTPAAAQRVCPEGGNTPPASVRGEEECVRGEEECVLWTEKYQPQHSSEVIGNTAAMKKLLSWMKEWRMRADVEERRKRREERLRMQEESNESWDCGDFKGEVVMEEVEVCNTLLIQGPSGAGKTAAVYACAEELGYTVFEVNSSSLRSAHTVLSQLREATQSHQVVALRSDSPKPQNNSIISSTTPAATSQKTSRRISGKRGAAPAVTLQHFFNPDVVIKSDSKAEVSRDERGINPALARNNRTPLISLILFEEVDVIFSDDVGFLSAIKTLMTTTKRPILLTTNDPLFGQRFEGRFEAITFKTPPVELSGSYLECVCVVENVYPDPRDLRVLLEDCGGDVRRSVLELELWSRSGGGNTLRTLQNQTLTCGSWTELEHGGCLDVLTERWRRGQSFFYTNLERLFSVNAGEITSEAPCPRFEKEVEKDASALIVKGTRAGKLSRRKEKEHKAPADELRMKRIPSAHLQLDNRNQSPSPVEQTDQSESCTDEDRSSKLVSFSLDSLAKFFDSMSFLDSSVYKQQLQVPGQCRPGPLGWTGARLSDSLVDEQREEDVLPHLERSTEILAVLEALVFQQCKGELSETRRSAEKLKELIGRERFAQLMQWLVISESPDAPVSRKSESVDDQEKRDVIHKVLSSKAFCCHGNKAAVVMDYLSVLRSICRMEREKQRNRPRSLHYLSDIRLPLPRSALKALASATLHPPHPSVR